ncbi:MAG TPA: DUF1028 domain-containing protein [Caulobacteraceae bacterium]|nr:DUF1028 domain-containing protein [Caulobacteraceae bacterium]
MTWSIVAYDPEADAFGAAVATKAFAAGTFVPFVAGVHDIDVIEAGWRACGWDIRFKR